MIIGTTGKGNGGPKARRSLYVPTWDRLQSEHFPHNALRTFYQRRQYQHIEHQLSDVLPRHCHRRQSHVHRWGAGGEESRVNEAG